MRVLPCPLEVPPTRARRLGGAEEKNAGGGRTIGVWTRLFRGGGGRTLAHLFRGGGSKNYYLGDLYTLQTAKLTALQASSRSTCSAAEAIYVQRCDDQPAADPACCFDCPVDPAPAEQ